MPYFVTFYSFKGGAGRTTTMLNVACLLARQYSVFLWEMDLEAPSLLDVPYFCDLRGKVKGGVVNLLDGGDNLGDRLAKYVVPHPGVPGDRLRVLPAGVPGDEYATHYAKARLDTLFSDKRRGPVLFERMRREIDKYACDFVFIDSRTGLTDMGAVCTIQLPDAVFLVYQLSHQSLAGTRRVQLALSEEKLKRVVNHPPRVQRIASMVPSDDLRLRAERLEAAEKFNLKPNFEIPLLPSLLLEEDLWSMMPGNESTELVKAYRAIASNIEELAAVGRPERTRSPHRNAPDERMEKGRSFEQQVAEILRLKGYNVEVNELDQGSQVDLIATRRDILNEEYFLVECKNHERPSPVDHVRGLHARVAASPVKHARGLLVTRAGFTAEAAAQARNLPLGLITYDNLLNDLLNLRDYRTSLILDYEGKEIERLYVDQEVTPEGAKEPQPLFPHIEQWLENPTQTFLAVLGDYGTGKTWFTRKLAWHLAKRFREDSIHNRQPIRISLKDVSKAFTLENILYDHFQQANQPQNPKSILLALEEGRLVLILDAFDEMATQSNWDVTLQNFRELARAASGRAKVILTCRTHYFKDRQKEQEAVRNSGTQLYSEIFGRQGFSIAYIEDFRQEQVDLYLEKACGPKAPEIRAAIASIRGVRELAGRPVLLDMIVTSAPLLAESAATIKIGDLYRVYTEHWMRREDWRLRLTRNHRTVLVEELAVKLWQSGDAKLHYRELMPVLRELMRDRIRNLEDLEIADQEVRTASFLTRDAEGNYGFSHRTFLEFFLAQRLVRNFDLRLNKLTPPAIQFLRDLMPERLEWEVLAVLVAPYVPQASENALRISSACKFRPADAQLQGANLAGEQFPDGLHLVGANLQGAHLSEATLAKARLQGANLRQADLTRARLASSDLTNATFEDATLAGATLNWANCTGTNFTGADLSFASLFEAKEPDLSGVAPRQRFGLALHPGDPQELTPVVQTGLPPAYFITIAVSADALLAVGNSAGAIRIFDCISGWCRRIVTDSRHGIQELAFRYDGSVLAWTSVARDVGCWDTKSGKPVFSVLGGDVTSLAFSSGDTRLATGSRDGTIQVWDSESGVAQPSFPAVAGAIVKLAFSTEINHLASISTDRTFRVWDASTGEIRFAREPSETTRCLAFSLDGRFLGLNVGSVIQVLETDAYALEKTLDVGANVLSLAFLEDATLVYATQKSIGSWNPSSGARTVLLDHENFLNFTHWLASAPSRQFLASVNFGMSLMLWDLNLSKILPTVPGFRNWVKAVSLVFSAEIQIVSSDEARIHLWDPLTGRQLRTLPAQEGILSISSVRHDHFVAATSFGEVYVWDIVSSSPPQSIRNRGTPWNFSRSSPDGQYLAFGHHFGATLLDVSSGRFTQEFALGRTISALAFSPDGSVLAMGTPDVGVVLHSTQTGEHRATVPTQQVGFASALAFCPDGQTLAIGIRDTVYLSDIRDNGPGSPLGAHAADIGPLQFSPSGRILASGSADKTIILWNPPTGAQIATLRGHHAAVTSLAWLDDRYLISASTDGSIRRWDTATGLCEYTAYQLPEDGWVTIYPDNRFRANEVGKRYLTYAAPDWALYPAELFPELEITE